jgi:heavy metal sensor kinase
MSLSARLSAFFLAALAVVLAGFSVSLYLLARAYLERQTEERLAAALDVLTAAVEVKKRVVEWEPNNRQLPLGLEDDPSQVRWMVHDGRGQPVQRSRNLGRQDLRTGTATANDGWGQRAFDIDRDGQPWRVVQRRILPEAGDTSTAPAALEKGEYHALVLTSAVSLEPMQDTLRTLALTLAGLSAGLWVLAAVLGWWLCRRALVPLTRMASAARAMHAADRDQRLPVPPTHDELQDLGQSFNDLLARLQEAYERQQRFTGDASHQLRTPLTAMLGQVEVTLRRDRSPDEYRHVLGLVHAQATQLRQIVEMLLFLARADSEARMPHLEILDLDAWLADFLGHHAGQPRAADLRRESAGGHKLVRAQPALLGQLVANLVDNAFKFSPPGTPVVLRTAAADGTVMLDVEDHGCGIAPEHLSHLFEPFYRALPGQAPATPGVGLGLAVVQRIAQAFGGTVTVQSEPGRGSRFRLTLPAQVRAAHAASLRAE